MSPFCEKLRHDLSRVEKLRRPFVVVYGLPGSGKSTLARRLAGLLNLPVIDKDDILESDAILQDLAMASPSALLVSFWHVTGMQKDSGLASQAAKTQRKNAGSFPCVPFAPWRLGARFKRAPTFKMNF